MTRRPPEGRHLDAGTALDFLEDRLAATRRRQVEAHLGSPCPECRERLRALGNLVETMRSDRTPQVPADLHDRVLGLFTPAAGAVSPRDRIDALARLIFDSWTSPLPAATRRAVGEVRRLRFALGDDVLELERESEGRGIVSLRGWIRTAEPSMWTVRLVSGDERRSVQPDAQGTFSLERVPVGKIRLTLEGPGVRFRIDAIPV